MPEMMDCPMCGGSGKITLELFYECSCPECDGAGEVPDTGYWEDDY
jgi:DnaJ-class molecular chaperone